MNQNEKDDLRRDGDAEASGSSPPKSSLSPHRKRNKTTVAIACAVLFLVLYALVNFSGFSALFSKLLSLLAPIILGAFFAYLLNPILKFYEFKVFKKIKKKKAVQTLSMLATYLTAALILTAFLFLIIPQLMESIMDFAGNFDQHLSKTTRLINRFINWFVGKNHMEEFVDEEAVLRVITGLLNKSGDLLSSIMDHIIQYGSGLLVGIKNFALAFFISIYLLAAKERLFAQTKKLVTALFSPKGKRRIYRYARLCDRTFGGFFIGKIIDSLIIGVITLFTLLIFRMPYAFLVSAIVCITNVIPFFGPFIGAIPSFLIIFIASPLKAFIFLILILIIQQLDGNVIGPKILGNTTGISSLGVIISITIMGDAFGIIGMLAGVPLFAVLVSLVKEFTEYRLKKKSLSPDTADYYAEDALVDPHEPQESVSARIFRNIGHGFAKLFRPLRRKKRKSNNSEQEKQKNRENSEPETSQKNEKGTKTNHEQ